MGARDGAIEELYRRRQGAFQVLLATVTGSIERARDVVQEAFARALREQEGVPGAGSLEVPMWRLAFRVALGEGGPDAIAVEAAARAATVDPARDPDLAAALGELAPELRLAVLLHYLAGLPDAAIGELIGTAVDVAAEARAGLGARLGAGDGVDIAQADPLAARLGALAVAPLPADWADVQRRAGRRRGRRPAALLVAVALVVIAAGSALALGRRAGDGPSAAPATASVAAASAATASVAAASAATATGSGADASAATTPAGGADTAAASTPGAARAIDFRSAAPAPAGVVAELAAARVDARLEVATELPFDPGEARTIIDLRRPDGSTAYVAVAPRAGGGFCMLARALSDRGGGGTTGCVDPETARADPIMPGGSDSGRGYGGFAGSIARVDVDRLVLRYEDDVEDEVPVVWVSAPIDAGFFAFDPGPDRYGEGHRAAAFVALDAAGREVARHQVLWVAPVVADPTGTPSPTPVVPGRAGRWTITDLGTLGGAATSPTAINDRGEVVGVSCVVDGCALGDRDGRTINPAVNGTGVVAGFVWGSGSMSPIFGPGGAVATPYAIDERGRVVGTTPEGAFTLQDGGAFGLTAPVPEAGTAAYAVNGRGQVVGSRNDPSEGPVGTTHAVLWDAGGARDLGSLGGPIAIATAINERGQVAGWSCLDGQPCAPFPDIPSAPAHAFLWDDGAMRDLGTLGGSGSYAYAINERGQVVGESTPADGGGAHAFLWEDGAMRDLGTLGGDRSVAYGINDAGVVVGWSATGDGPAHAFVWQDGVMADLQAGRLRGLIGLAAGVNARGQIVGSVAAPAQDCARRCEMHGVLWTPVPDA